MELGDAICFSCFLNFMQITKDKLDKVFKWLGSVNSALVSLTETRNDANMVMFHAIA